MRIFEKIFRKNTAATHVRRNLRFALSLLCLVLGLLLWQLLSLVQGKASEQGFLQQRFYAEQSAAALARIFYRIIEVEESRPFDQYSYYNVLSGIGAVSPELLQRSPLSEMQPANAPAGLVGYFQIQPDGELSTPLLPEARNELNVPELVDRAARQEVANRIGQILSKIEAGPHTSVPVLSASRNAVSQEALLNVKTPQQQGLQANSFYDQRFLQSLTQQSANQTLEDLLPEKASNFSVGKNSKQKGLRKDVGRTTSQPWHNSLSSHLSASSKTPEVVTFEAEVDPLQAMSIAHKYLIFFRKTWRGNQRIIQGFVVQQHAFFENIVSETLLESSLAPQARMVLAYGEKPVLKMTLPELSARGQQARSKGENLFIDGDSQAQIPEGESLLFNASLPAPLQAFSIYFSLPKIPMPPGSNLILQLAIVLAGLTLLGFFMLYRTVCVQNELAEKRRNFVAAVSHELRTPLTSIRMYAEMLRDGWVVESGKQKQYYDFICNESERLGRLIGNVLRLARIEKGHSTTNLVSMKQLEVVQFMVKKTAAIAETQGFQIVLKNDLRSSDKELIIEVDEDALTQIALNLVENALKFAQKSMPRHIEIGSSLKADTNQVVVFVRDFGPGVVSTEQKKIFELFYRSENEMTRTSSGTGIGLALVHELAHEMNAQVRYQSRDPGAEFQILFPVREPAL